MNLPAIIDRIFDRENFRWLVGYLQGDGTVDSRNGVWFISADRELVRSARAGVKDLFGLDSHIYAETSKSPGRPKLRLAVYSRTLVRWLKERGFKFGRKEWNVPKMPKHLFCPYLGGLFDAEGHIELRNRKSSQAKIRRVVIYRSIGVHLT